MAGCSDYVRRVVLFQVQQLAELPILGLEGLASLRLFDEVVLDQADLLAGEGSGLGFMKRILRWG